MHITLCVIMFWQVLTLEHHTIFTLPTIKPWLHQSHKTKAWHEQQESQLQLKLTPLGENTYKHKSCVLLGLWPKLKCGSLTSWKRILTRLSPYRPRYDEICLVAYLACSLLKPLTCQDPCMASIDKPHLSDVRTIGNRWAFNCIFVQIAK